MFSAVILAGGKGERFGSSIPKPFMSLNGKPVIQYSIDVIEPLVDELIIVSNTQYKDYRCVNGGKFRSNSVYNGVVRAKGDYVIIHDGARPFIRKETIVSMKQLLLSGYDVVDTVAPIIDGFIDSEKSQSKDGKKLGLTPEGFKKKDLLEAFELTQGMAFQDEITMMQFALKDLKCVFLNGEIFNSKITFEQDLAYAEGIMKFWSRPITTKSDLNKRVLVIGGSGGIGKACIDRLPNADAPSHKELDMCKNFEIDLSKYDAIIHSAGEYKNLDRIMQVNFNSCMRLVELAEKQNWTGNIVFLSSTAATYGRRGIPLYSASKSALNAYIESRHEELAERGIYINAIAPAKVDTKLQESINPDTPKKDMMTPEYVADFVLRYIDANVSGDIIYLRKGFDERPRKATKRTRGFKGD